MKYIFIGAILLLSAMNVSAQVETEEKNSPPPSEIQVVKEDTKSNGSVIEFPDREAKFKGGVKGLKAYITNNVRYPDRAMEYNIQGKIYLSFVVEKNGKITEIKIEKGVHPLLDQEALRVVKKMPRWKPGKHKGKKVRTRCSLPIVFVIQND